MFLIIIIIIILLTCNPASLAYGDITIPLLHHDSLHSPLYNHSASLWERVHFDLETSVMRASSISIGRLPPIIKRPPRPQAGFLANILAGSTGLDQFVFIDTINSLFWINCEPCSVLVTPPIFDPTKSKSYRTQECINAEECVSTREVDVHCNDNHQDGCSFEVSYAGNYYSSGNLGIEEFVFMSSDEVLNVTFGCSHDSNMYGANGIIGLGTTSSLSILKQHNFSTFSYCVGNINDQSYTNNKLILGNSLNIKLGNVTPLSVGDDHYYINLEAIYFNEYPLDFDPNLLRRNPDDSSGGMVVDISSTYTFLPHVVYEKFVAAVYMALSSNFVKNESFPYQGQSRLCYNGVSHRDLSTFPPVRLHFEGGAIMKLVTNHLFVQVSEENFCLAVLPIDKFYPGSTASILGILVQQYLHVGFDLELRTFVFQRADCSLIDLIDHD